MNNNDVISVDGLTVFAQLPQGETVLVENVDLSLHAGQIMGLVGETGAGKTLTMKAILGLLPAGMRAAGTVRISDQQPLNAASRTAMAGLRGRHVGMVLQNPMGMFDPLIRVGSQVVEGVVLRGLLTRELAWDRALELLASMGFDSPQTILRLYPHQLSGGMSQRVAIAMAMMPRPSLIVADEPTTALDANLRLEVLDLLKSVATRSGSAVVMVSHDLGLLSHFCDSISVMYAGRIVEQGAISSVLAEPEHPYTAALLRCSPSLADTPRQPLPVIAGALPVSGFWPAACVFEPRCPVAFERCRKERPLLRRSESRAAACHLAFAEKG